MVLHHLWFLMITKFIKPMENLIQIKSPYNSLDKLHDFLKESSGFECSKEYDICLFLCVSVCTEGSRLLLNRYGSPLQCNFS